MTSIFIKSQRQLLAVSVCLCAFLSLVMALFGGFQALPLTVPPDQSTCDPSLTAYLDYPPATTLVGSDINNAIYANVCVIITGKPTIDTSSNVNSSYICSSISLLCLLPYLYLLLPSVPAGVTLFANGATFLFTATAVRLNGPSIPAKFARVDGVVFKFTSGGDETVKVDSHGIISNCIFTPAAGIFHFLF